MYAARLNFFTFSLRKQYHIGGIAYVFRLIHALFGNLRIAADKTYTVGYVRSVRSVYEELIIAVDRKKPFSGNPAE